MPLSTPGGCSAGPDYTPGPTGTINRSSTPRTAAGTDHCLCHENPQAVKVSCEAVKLTGGAVQADAPDFAGFVEARERALQRTAWLLTGDWAPAEDLVQTALARTWPRWALISERDDPEIYVRLLRWQEPGQHPPHVAE